MIVKQAININLIIRSEYKWRGIGEPTVERSEPYELSRGRLEGFLNCEACLVGPGAWGEIPLHTRIPSKYQY